MLWEVRATTKTCSYGFFATSTRAMLRSVWRFVRAGGYRRIRVRRLR